MGFMSYLRHTMDHPSAQNITILYKRFAKAWQRVRRQSDFVEKNWLDLFLNQIKPHGTILDLGCGDGQPIAEYCVEKGFPIVGIDSAKPFIKAANKQFPEQVWMQEDMRSFPITQKFDAIIAWDSLFHLTRNDQKMMFTRFEQLSTPDAALMFTSGHSNGEAIGDFNGHELYHASLAEEEYRALLIEHGFGLLSYKLEDQNCGGRSVWLAIKRAS